MTCGTPDQVVASILGIPHSGTDASCLSSLQSYWIDLAGWPFPLDVYLPYFGTTLFLELIALLVLLLVLRKKIDRRWVQAWLLVNVATHPLVFYGTPWLSYRFQVRWDVCALIAEIYVLLFEAWIYSRFTKVSLKRAVLISWIVNLTSWWLGPYVLTALGMDF